LRNRLPVEGLKRAIPQEWRILFAADKKNLDNFDQTL